MLGSGTDKCLPSVPRSKGCITCVERRIRCDGARPRCRACERRGELCGGYRRAEIVFLNEGWRTLGVAAASKHKPLSASTVKTRAVKRHAPRSIASENETAQNTDQELKAAAAGAEMMLIAQPDPGRSQLQAAFFLSSFGHRPFQSLGTIANLFKHYLMLPAPAGFLGLPGTRNVESSTPVRLAVHALACGHFGTAHSDATSLNDSSERYGMALRSMSVRLQQMSSSDYRPHNITEEEWQHFAFFCLVMAFWEMKMLPSSRTWEAHVRSLASAIGQRGNDHTYSDTNRQLLASSRLLLTLQSLSARQPNNWQHCLPVRSAWLTGIKSALRPTENPFFDEDFRLYQSLDLLMLDVSTVTSIMSEFDGRFAEVPPNQKHPRNRQRVALVHLYARAVDTLSRNEARLADWQARISEAPPASWLSISSHASRTEPLSSDMGQHFTTVLVFDSMLAYHAIMTYWTIIMSLRLLLSDMLTLMPNIGTQDLLGGTRHLLQDHQSQLMEYAINVLRTVCYATDTESNAVAPFAFTAAFQLTVKVLDREIASLERDREVIQKSNDIRRCQALKTLATQFLEWAVRNKIPVKMD